MDMDAFWQFMTETSILGISLADVMGKLILVTVVAVIARMAEQALARIMRHVIDRAKIPSASFLVNVVRGVIWSLALMTVLEPVFGVQPTAFVATLGVGSLALSMGMQDTVSNAVGGFALMTTKVIKVGDIITFGGFTGTVADIDWRSTYVVDSYGQVNLIPNSIISKTALIKLSDATKNCCVLPLAIEHGTDLEQAQLELMQVASECLGDWADPKRDPWITVVNLDPGSINAQISVPLMHGVSADHARTRIAGGLSKVSWVRKP